MTIPTKLLRDWLPLAAWTAAIFTASGPMLGAPRTSSMLEAVLATVTGHRLSADTIYVLNVIIRKGGHVVAYGLEGLLALRAVRGGRPGFTPSSAAAAIAIALAVASTDELRQSMHASRTGSAWDVVLDVAAASVALAMVARRDRRTPPGDE